MVKDEALLGFSLDFEPLLSLAMPACLLVLETPPPFRVSFDLLNFPEVVILPFEDTDVADISLGNRSNDFLTDPLRFPVKFMCRFIGGV